MSSQCPHDELQAGAIALFADCHVRPGQIDWPDGLADSLEGCDLIVTLGDMGEAAGLATLAKLAPVIGVTGGDDPADPRWAPQARTFGLDGLTLGAVFDPVKAGLASSADPFIPIENLDAAATQFFGRKIDVLLHGATHNAAIGFAQGKLVLDPGSATWPIGKEEGVPGKFIHLRADGGTLRPRIVSL